MSKNYINNILWEKIEHFQKKMSKNKKLNSKLSKTVVF